MTASRLAAILFALGAGVLPAAAGGVAGDFDFYVLSLSWSPSYCESADDPDETQCSRRLGFVVHGLWPQYEHGYPDYCVSTGPRRVPPATVAALDDLMPSDGLVQYQWQKHGICSGLSPESYFALMRRAAERVAIPAAYQHPVRDVRTTPSAIESAFVSANPGLQTRGMAVSCSRSGEVEVRICLDKDMGFRRCLDVDGDGCRRPSLTLPAPR